MRISVRKGSMLLYSQSYRFFARQSVCVGCFRLFVQIAKPAWFEMAMFWKGLLASVTYCILFLERGHTQVVAYCIFLACNSWDSIVFACVCVKQTFGKHLANRYFAVEHNIFGLMELVVYWKFLFDYKKHSVLTDLVLYYIDNFYWVI